MVATVGNVNEMLDGHVVLDLECLDRMYLNAYVPTLQVGGRWSLFSASIAISRSPRQP